MLSEVALGQLCDSSSLMQEQCWHTWKRGPKCLTGMIHRSHGLDGVTAVNILLQRLPRSQLVFTENKLSEVKGSLLVRKIVL